MKQLRHVLALTLVFCMVFGMVTPSLAVSGEISVEEDYGIPVEEDGGIEIEVDDRSDYDIDEDREELSVLPKQDETADETNTTGKVDGYNYNIIHLDCGRKYFSVDSIKKIIDNASAAGFNYIQLAVGNDGMRFLLDDMSLTVNGTTYDSNAVSAAIHAGNEAYYNFDIDELTQSEMDVIIAYAYTKGMGVIPLINTPGHMDAILDAAEKLTKENCAFSSDGKTSVRTIDVTPDSTAVKFTKAFLTKYITYFAGKGCKYFNMGADEYANDAFSSGSMGFGKLQDLGKYGNFVTYVNEVATLIKNAGMKPMAFNDGIYFNNNTSGGTFDTDIIIEYWSSGWSSYKPMPASDLADKGFKMVNTHGDYYWVLGKTDAQCSPEKARGFDKTVFPGSTISNPGGSTFCIWSDYPGAETEESVISKTADTIEAFGGKLPTVDSVTNGGTTDPVGKTVEITLNVGESTTRTINGAAVNETIDDNVAKVVAVDASVAGETTYTLADTIVSGNKYCISDGNGNYLSVNSSGAIFNVKISENNPEGSPTEWTIEKSGNSYTIKDETTGYYLCYTNSQLNVSKTSYDRYWDYYQSGFNVTRYGNTYYIRSYNSAMWYLSFSSTNHGLPYTKTTTTEPKTSVTIAGKAPGNTTAVVGNVTYNITVNAIEESKSLTVSSGNTAALNVPTLDTNIVGNTTTIYKVTFGSEYITVNETNGTITARTVTDDKTATVVAKVKNASDVVLATYTYNVTITKENLDEVTPITVEYWITNDRVKPSATGATSRTIAANESTVYSENGALFSELVPATGTRANDVNNTINMVYWKGTRLTSDNKQTDNKGDNKTLAGDDFTYIRYWNEKWSFFSTKTESWEDFNNTDQIVAYYLHRTEVTEEIDTEVVDWGHVPPSSIGSSYGGKYILIDYAVKYQSGERSPNSFIAAGKTQSFHCDPVDKVTVRYDLSEKSYYRELNMVFARETANYEVYMITVTPTKEKLPYSPSDITDSYSYEYDYNDEVTVDGIGSEKVIWVDDEANLGVFANAKYKSISGKYVYHVGGDPIIPGVEVYNLNGMLITYYIRAKANPDSLTVHYMDRTHGDIEFYSYPIDVNQGTTFREGANLPEIPEAYGIPTHITNGDVLNSLGKTQHVSSVLATMPEISATYRYSSYKCVEVVRSEDGKDLYLYYTFKNTHSFVVDFGVPLHLTTSDIAISGNWTSYTATQGKYGTVEYNGNQIGGGITYNPTKIMQGRDEIAVTLNHKNPSDEPATHFIYLYPATNVLYEENVITNPGTEWTTVTSVFTPATDEEGKNITTQSAEKLGNEEKNVHGYDDYYSENNGFSGGSAYKATLDASKTATEFGKPLTFEFTGNGFDLISECGPQTGALLVRVYKDGVLNHGFFVDTYFTGDNTGIINSADADINGVLDYQVPVVRDINLEHGTYKVEVYGYMVNRSTTSTASLYSVDSAETYIEQALKDLGLDDDASLYEVSFMDENSVLNDNAVASDVVRSGVSVQSMADEVMAATDATQYVYVDGIRVYHTIDVAAEPEYTAKEKGTKYYNVYDFINTSVADLEFMKDNFAVYVEYDGKTGTYSMVDYKKQGPENEVYLTSGSAIAFILGDGYSAGNVGNDTVQLAIKAVNGSSILKISKDDTYSNEYNVYSNTEMYYTVPVRNKTLDDGSTVSYVLIENPVSDDKTVVSISGLKVSKDITPVADVVTMGNILKAESGTNFTPETFSVQEIKSVKAKRKFSVSAYTSSDANQVIVSFNGKKTTLTPTNTKAVEAGATNIYTYSYTFAAPAVKGNYDVSVVACSTADNTVKSDPITMTVVVK